MKIRNFSNAQELEQKRTKTQSICQVFDKWLKTPGPVVEIRLVMAALDCIR